MRKFFAVTLLAIGVSGLGSAVYLWSHQSTSSQIAFVESAPIIPVTMVTIITVPEIEETTTTVTTPVTTVPMSEGDFQLETPEPIDIPDPISIEIRRVGISAPVENVTFEQPNSCGRYNNPCPGKVDAWTDTRRVGVCESGASFLTGHTVWSGKSDAFTNLIDDWEFSNDKGVVAGDQVAVTLANGQLCLGKVVDFAEGPGEKVPDSPARFFVKPELGASVADALSDVAGSDSVGFLMTSYCGLGPKCEWFKPGELNPGDNSWHRRYTAVVMVLWDEVASLEEQLSRQGEQ